MKKDFVGRKFELEQLKGLYDSPKSKLSVVYGRRRIGKSYLIDHFMKSYPHFKIEGLEGEETPDQIRSATQDLAKQLQDETLQYVKYERWELLFDYITRHLQKQTEKTIIFMDEFQWLAVGRTKLVSLLKKYWDNHWKKNNVLLILCGSVSSYMVKKVIRSTALYGRIDFELCLGPFFPNESLQMLKNKRSLYEVFKYLLVFGGIPKYLESIDINKSFSQNMNTLFFLKSSPYTNEFEKIFYSQFQQHSNYEKIVRFLAKGPKTLENVASHLKVKSSGGVKTYLENLERALFLTSYVPFDKPMNSKLKKYKLTDEHLRFYFKYVFPNLRQIQVNQRKNLFNALVASQSGSWFGFAFENFCLKNAEYIAEKLGFVDQVIGFGPFFVRGDRGFQVDLMYKRADKVLTLCEIKYYDSEISPAVIAEVERKCQKVKVPRGYTLEKALISQFGPDRALKDSGYFHHDLDVKGLF